MMADEQAGGELRDVAGAEVGGPAVARRQEQIGEHDSVGDPDEIGFGGEADEDCGQGDGEETSCQAQGETMLSQSADQETSSSGCSLGAQLQPPEVSYRTDSAQLQEVKAGMHRTLPDRGSAGRHARQEGEVS